MADVVNFVADLVRIPSYSDQEGPIVEFAKRHMEQLGYDEVFIDRVGNVVGRVGNGPSILHFDSHVDTVRAEDAEAWSYPPFSGEIVDGKLYGRGSVDMKAALGASIYAAAMAKKALFRPLGERSPDPFLKELETRLLREINETHVGPMGFGGEITGLEVFIEKFPTHLAGLPVAVNLNCHSLRRKTIEL